MCLVPGSQPAAAGVTMPSVVAPPRPILGCYVSGCVARVSRPCLLGTARFSAPPYSLRDMDHIVSASLGVFERPDDDRSRPQSRWAGSQACPPPSALNGHRIACWVSQLLKELAAPSLVERQARSRRRWLVAGILAVWGPGLVVMLADTDAGSLITAAQSGSEWGYRMILPELVLIPVLYVVQEMTVRLGILTNKGHGALIRETFGKRWALFAALPLFASGVGALFTEYAGIAGVGGLVGVPRTVTVPVAAAFLIGVAMTGSYRRAERIGIALGLAELVFIPAVAMAHPSLSAVGRGLGHLPLGNSSFVFLLAANVGAVIMPWMVFYQQGAVLDKGLQPRNIPSERRDTAVGAGLTQLIMIAVVLTFAATVGRSHLGVQLHTVTEMSSALRPFLGAIGAKVLLGTAVLGAALVAALVASLAGAWGIAEVFGWPAYSQRATRPKHGEVLPHLWPGARTRGNHRASQLELGQVGDRRRGNERDPPADRARLPVAARSTRPAERTSDAWASAAHHDHAVPHSHCFRAVPGACDTRMGVTDPAGRGVQVKLADRISQTRPQDLNADKCVETLVAVAWRLGRRFLI